MTDEEIKLNAEKFANRYEIRGTSEGEFRYMDKLDAYIEGAHSRDEEITYLTYRLNDTIEKLQTVITQRDNLHNPWISAAVRLPKTKDDSPSGIILAMCNDTYDLDDTHCSIPCLIPCIFKCVEVDENIYQWESLLMDYEYEISDISTWMPIPKLKKEE